MSDKLVHIQPGQLAVPDPSTGGLGMDSSLFQNIKPSFLEIVQKSTRQDNVQIGKFRDTATNQHYDEMRWVLLDSPRKQREWFKEKNDFSRENKHCFSVDNVVPHAKAQHPPAMECSTCPMGDINWNRYNETKNPDHKPPCRSFWRLFLADRATQMPYIFNVKGTAISPFEKAMSNLARTVAMQTFNVKVENKKRAAAGQPLLPAPNIFDFTFTVYPYQAVKGGPWILGIKDIKQLSDEGRLEFGALYIQYTQARLAVHEVAQEEEAPVKAAPSTSPTEQVQEVQAVIGEPVLTRDGKEVTI